MDDVICDTYSALRCWADMQFGIGLEDKLGYPIHSLLSNKQLLQMKAMLDEGSFFATLRPLPNAIEVLRGLVDRHDVFIVTAAMEHPASMPYKFKWVAANLPFIDPLRIVFCGEKHVADVDFLVDDSPRHFEKLRGEGIVFSAPKNRGTRGYKRVNNWLDVADMFG